jgi:hypothetical protein
METENSLPHTQGPATCPRPELCPTKDQSKSEAVWDVL